MKRTHTFKNIEFYNAQKANEAKLLGKPLICIKLSGYNKFGNGQQIAIVDDGFYTTQTSSGSDHADLDSQISSNFGTFTAAFWNVVMVHMVMAAAGGDGSVYLVLLRRHHSLNTIITCQVTLTFIQS